MTFTQLERILARVTYRSGWQLHCGSLGDGHYLQVQFYDGGVLQRCRKWYVSTYSTTSEVVQTAFKACLAAEEHEARERFRYHRKQVFGPHFNVADLMTLCDQPLDVRTPP